MARIPKANRPQCCARTRAGRPCCARVVARDDGSLAARCRLHGGLSTGPRTAAGRERIAAAQRARWARVRASQARIAALEAPANDLADATFDGLAASGAPFWLTS